MRPFGRPLALLALLCAAPLQACVYGWAYTETTRPLVIDMRETPGGTRMVELSSHFVKEPISGFGIGAEWHSRAIGEAAKQKGLHDVHFADLRTLSLLGGIYKRQTIEVWGD